MAILAGPVSRTIGLTIIATLLLCQPKLRGASEKYVILAEHSKSEYKIAISPLASEVEKFAAAELQKYLNRITGATLPVTIGRTTGKAILVGRAFAPAEAVNDSTLGFDGFIIDTKPEAIVLAGVNGRATLFSVYAFLEKMGCRWFAPNFDFYHKAQGEYVPKLDVLRAPIETAVVKPSMKYRKEDIGEGRTHTLSNLRQIIDWMPKVRMNVFMSPLDYGGRGTVVWDNWRLDLIPELKKRGLLVEIGGHGYQNFLPQAKYFAKRSEWFGMVDGKRSSDERLVFESSNPDAMAEFLRNIEAYLRGHPEVDIFDLWPPDGAKWSESPESVALGSPTRRHALIVNAVAKMVKREFPRLVVEFLAYADYIVPPKDVVFEDNTTLDFCPISRSFQTPLWADQNEINRQYSQALDQWLRRDVFKGNIAIYTYYRKYAWRSLPIVIPRLIAQEIKHYQAVGVNGMSIYSEPGNWFTFELNNYIISRATFDSNLDADQVLLDYAQKRFAPASNPIFQYFQIIETVAPALCRIPGTVVHDQHDLERGKEELGRAADLLKQAAQLSTGDDGVSELVTKLQRELEYASNDLQIRLVAWRISRGSTWRDEAVEMVPLLKQRRDLLQANEHLGIFVIDPTYIVF